MTTLESGTAEAPAVVTLAAYDGGVILLGLGLLVALQSAALIVLMGRE